MSFPSTDNLGARVTPYKPIGEGCGCNQSPRSEVQFLSAELRRNQNPLEYTLTKKLELAGTQEMRYSTIKCIFETLKYSEPIKHLKKLMNPGATKTGDEHVLMDIDVGIWREFTFKSERTYRRDPQRVSFCGTTEKGYRIIVPYNPKEPVAISIDLWRNKEVLTLGVPDDDYLRIFWRIAHKLGGNPKALMEPIEIEGEVLRLGHWLSAFTCKVMGDMASYNQYHDEGLESV